VKQELSMMADSPELRQDAEEYWRAAREFVRVLIAELNDSLKESGVWKARRRRICTRFAFGFASYFDQQWMKVGGKTRYPLLCFTTSFLDMDVALSDLPSILCPHRSVELHAMVSDEVDCYFRDMKEDGKAVITGAVGEETEDTDEVPEIPSTARAVRAPVSAGIATAPADETRTGKAQRR